MDRKEKSLLQKNQERFNERIERQNRVIGKAVIEIVLNILLSIAATLATLDALGVINLPVGR